jgi:hypothetical protein
MLSMSRRSEQICERDRRLKPPWAREEQSGTTRNVDLHQSPRAGGYFFLASAPRASSRDLTLSSTSLRELASAVGPPYFK